MRVKPGGGEDEFIMCSGEQVEGAVVRLFWGGGGIRPKKTMMGELPDRRKMRKNRRRHCDWKSAGGLHNAAQKRNLPP